LLEAFLHNRGYTFFTMPGLTYQEIKRLVESRKKIMSEKDLQWLV